jgi:tetratricopeptide (TPR) repeat protein
MKKLLIFVILILLNCFLFSQNEKLSNIIEYLKSGDLTNAKKGIDEVFDTGNIRDSKFWMYRAFVYQAIYESESANIKAMDNDPINKAYKSYLEALKYDTIKENFPLIISSLKILSNEFVYEGIKEYNDGNFEKSFTYFNNTLTINNMPSIMMLDTIIIYNAALAAEKCSKYDVAEGLFSNLLTLKYGGLKIYSDFADLYKAENKPELMIKTLNEGLKYYPNDTDNKYLVINKLIDYYRETSNTDESIKYLEMALDMKPDNSIYYYNLGSFYQQKNVLIKAETNYKKAIRFDSTNVDALFNLGAINYNQGVDLIKLAKDKKQKAEADSKYALALPFFEKCLKLNPKDIQTMKLLKTIYTILNYQDKLKEIDHSIESIKQ